MITSFGRNSVTVKGPVPMGLKLASVHSGALAPVIDRAFPLDQIVEAHRHMESNTQCGKIVVTV